MKKIRASSRTRPLLSPLRENKIVRCTCLIDFRHDGENSSYISSGCIGFESRGNRYVCGTSAVNDGFGADVVWNWPPECEGYDLVKCQLGMIPVLLYIYLLRQMKSNSKSLES